MVTDLKPTAHADNPVCTAINDTLARIGDKWSVLVIVTLGQGPMRFGELKRDIAGISQKMLTVTVRGLERDGYLTRTVTPTIPPRVDYELTDLGRELLGPIRDVVEFARLSEPRIAAARAEFDARAAGDATAA